MPSKTYNWKRFWCPRTGNLSLIDRGYLYDPDTEWGRAYNSDVVAFESIAATPCLALLGEPGIGKTHALTAEYETVAAKIQEEGGQTLWLDLRPYGSEDRLVRDLFEDPTFQSWIKGDYTIHVFLDSLDECLLRLDNIAALLVQELQKYPVERLRLRIACRTADWPNTLEEGLRLKWGEQSIGVYELAPLRRVDVVEAARASGLDPNLFLDEIDRKEIAALAIKPVTLNLLVNIFGRTGQFPSTQAELYGEGCRLLCEETSESRRDAGRIGKLSANQRIIVAAHIAAITVFGGRYAVWTGIDRGDVPEVDVTVSQLCGGTEIADGSQFEISESTVRETLSTGLFSSRGPNRMGWAHQTYAEFLAASYLVQHEMTLGQIMSLIVSPGDPAGKLVPQLQEASAWLAGMEPEVFRKITRTDPQVLLRSDVATADVQDRAGLVEILLQQFDADMLLDSDWGIRRSYRKLAHPNLAAQLKPYVCDQTKGVIVRRVSTDIAEACELRSLQADLANIALDQTEQHEVRKNAAFAVSRIGDDDTRSQLEPLAKGEAGDDPDDGLKGCGLMAVWPSALTVKELFKALTPPQRPSLVGIYAMFLSSSVVANLTVSDLPEALKWVEEQLPKHELGHPFEDIVENIIRKSWDNLESPGVLEAFAKAALSRLRQYDLIFGTHGKSNRESTLSDNDDKRHLLLESVVSLLSDPETEVPLLAFSQTPIVLAVDLPWMVEQLQASQDATTQRAWVEVIYRAIDLREHNHPDLILEACQSVPILRERFSRFIEPVVLDSVEAEGMRAHHLQTQKWLNRAEERPLLEPPPAERIVAYLEAFESGDLAAWWHLNMEMTLEPDSRIYGSELQPDLKRLPGWEQAEQETRSRIVRSAKGYVFEQDPQTDVWLGTNTLHRPALAGYRALRLLLQEEPDFLTEMPTDTWKKWAPIILAYPTNSGLADEELENQLVFMAYQQAPTEIISTLLVLIEQENKQFDELFIMRRVTRCFDDHLVNALLNKAKEEDLKPGCMGSILGHLLDYRLGDARKFTESLLLGMPYSDEHLTSKAVVAATLLLTRSDDAGWEFVWPAIQQHPEFGQRVISNLANIGDRHAAKIGQRLTEEQEADLFIWVAHQYPYNDDPPFDGSNFSGNRVSISWWRESLLADLKNRGTQQACDSIRRIAVEVPELDWMKWTLQEAEKITRSRSWVPVKPDQILKLSGNQRLRLVESGEQLLEILIESLQRLELKLHGEVPASRDIWDKLPGGNIYRPILEEPFSDYVKRHLDEDIGQMGIVVNREVRIHRGERTDIYVNAVIPGTDGSYEVVTVIIEVKGCWNDELNHAMETQLANRYLKDNRCQHGLYLAAWFNCDKWDEGDLKKSKAPHRSIGEAQSRFDSQAVGLSQQGTLIKAFVMDTGLH